MALSRYPMKTDPHRSPETPGLFQKYVVTKANGEAVAPGADYFVLRLDTDKRARHAARTYARNIESVNPRLAQDLRDRCDRYGFAELERCTGLAATWCPVHGDCLCESQENGERSLNDAECPLHSRHSDHAERAEDR